MSPTNLTKPSPNGELVLQFLADAKDDLQRTKTAIKQRFGMERTPLDNALADLT
jgi:hypothetical protein